MNNKKNTNNAVSEIIGTMILLAIAVSVFSLVFIAITSNLDSPPDIYVNIIGSIDTEKEVAVLEHMGGDPLPLETKVHFKISGQDYIYTLQEIKNRTDVEILKSDGTDALEDNRWSIGETLYYHVNLSGKKQEILARVSEVNINKLVFIGFLQEGYKNRGGIWPFDECDGALVHDITNRNPPGNILPSDGPQWNSSAAKVNCSLFFNGFDDHVSVNDSEALDIVDNITVMAWINPLDEDYDINTVQLAQKFGMTPWIIHVNGDVHAVVSENVSKGGMLSTFNISNSGKITGVPHTEDNFGNGSSSKQLLPVIDYLSDNIYVVAYYDFDKNDKNNPKNSLKLRTYNITNNGEITKLDSINFYDFQINTDNRPSLVKVSDNIMAVAYRMESNDEGMIRTLNITSDGAITDTLDDWNIENDFFEPDLINVSNGIFTVAYRGPSDYGYIKTANIDSDGIITPKGDFPFNEECFELDILKITDEIYVILFRDENNYAKLRTVNISSDGTITDTGKSYTSDFTCYSPNIIHFIEDMYIFSYTPSSTGTPEGHTSVIEIFQDGSIGNSKINQYTFEEKKCLDPRIIQINKNICAIVYEGNKPSHPGTVRTILISSNIFPSFQRGINKIGSYGICANKTTVFGNINNKNISYKNDLDWKSNDWNHIALTYNGSEIILYINGISKESEDYTGSITETTSDLIIGKWSHGFIDEVAIYDWALSEDEIKDHLTAGYWILNN